jgi:hypothetical protein
MTVDGNILTIKVDLSAPRTPSSTGKMSMVSCTSGWKSVPGDSGARVNLMVGFKN